MVGKSCKRYFSVFSLFLFSPVFFSQISAELYNNLSANLKPKDKAHLTLKEKCAILVNDHVYGREGSEALKKEVEGYAVELEKLVKTKVSNQDKKRIYNALGYYYSYSDLQYPIEKWRYYFKKTIAIQDTGQESKKLTAHAFRELAIADVMEDKHESASENLSEALQYLTELKDSSGIALVHAYYYPLYTSLGLYESAIKELYEVDRLITVEQKRSGNDKATLLENEEGKALLFYQLYGVSKAKKDLDSATAHTCPCSGLKGPPVAICYYLNAFKYFLNRKYDSALVYLDSSLAEADYYPEIFANKIAQKGTCLIHLNRYKEGKELIDSALAMDIPYGLRADIYFELSNYAKDHGDYQNAYSYLSTAQRYRDSLNLTSARGKVFEVMQKNAAFEKEKKILNLEFEKAQEEKRKKILTLIYTAIGLALLVIIFVLYAISRARKVKALEAEAALERERKNLEDIMRLQNRELRRVRKKALNDLRKKISRDMHDELSSSLAALKYYVNDLRLAENDESHKKTLHNVELEVESVQSQARAYMHNLHAGIQEVMGSLNPFLQNISQDFSKKTGLELSLQYNKREIEQLLSVRQQNQLTLMLKEATTNVLKHSGATTITISISFSDGFCYFAIIDNGKGFSTREADSGLGLESMQLRIKRIRGEAKFTSSPDGTRIQGSFPLEKR